MEFMIGVRDGESGGKCFTIEIDTNELPTYRELLQALNDINALPENHRPPNFDYKDIRELAMMAALGQMTTAFELWMENGRPVVTVFYIAVIPDEMFNAVFDEFTEEN